MARPQDGASTFVTGGDVSRFARRTIPRPAAVAVVGADGSVSAVPAAPRGPVVRVTRGKSTSEESVGSGAGALLDRQAQGVRNAGRVAPLGLSTLR